MDSETRTDPLRQVMWPVRKLVRKLDKRRRLRSGADCVSFPKSGRTWLKFMLDRLALPIRFTHAGQVRYRAPVGNYRAEPHYDPDRRIVFLHRDPRDTVVSFYFEISKRIGIFDGTLAEFLRDPSYGIDAIIEYNGAWLDLLADKPNALVVTYEDMQDMPERTLRRIADHVAPPDRRPDDASVAAAVEAGAFGNMRRQEGKFVTWLVYGRALHPSDKQDRETFKVRRGKVGGFVDYFSAEDTAYADAALAASPHYRHLANQAAAE